MVTKSRFSFSGYIIRGIGLFLLFQVLTFAQQSFENKLPVIPEINGLYFTENHNDNEISLNQDFKSDLNTENFRSVKSENRGGESILYCPLKVSLNGGTGYYYYTYNNAGSTLSRIIESNGVYTSAVFNTYDSRENRLTELKQNYVSGVWKNVELISYTYDENNNRTSMLTQQWVNESWSNISFSTHTYNSSGYQLVNTYFKWSNEAWVATSRNTISYNQFNSPLIETYEKSTNGVLVFDNRRLHTYDAGIKLTQFLTQKWVNGDWLNVNLNSNYYDESGYVISQLTQIWSGNSWVNVSRALYTNNSLGKYLLDTMQVWESGNWINHTFYSQEYHQNGSMSVKIQKWWNRTINNWDNQWIWHDDYDAHNNLVYRSTGQWSDSGWVTSARQIMSYDENDNFVAHLGQSLVNGGWLTNYNLEYSYDVNGNCIYASAFDRDWLPIYYNLYLWYNNNSNLMSFNAKTVEVQYQTITEIKTENEILINFSLYQNYPNPFNPETVIRFALPEAGYVKGVVYDILGREVTTLLNGEMNSGNHEIMFDAKGIASGVYVFRLEAGKYSSAIKMIVNK